MPRERGSAKQVLTIRVDKSVRDRMEQIAEQERTTVSAVANRAFEEYLAQNIAGHAAVGFQIELQDLEEVLPMVRAFRTPVPLGLFTALIEALRLRRKK